MIASMKNRLVDQIHRLLSAGQTPGVDDLDLDPAELVPDLLHAMSQSAAAAAGRVVEEARDQGVTLHPAHIPASEMGRHAHDAAEQVTIRLSTVAARAVEQAPADATVDETVAAARAALADYGDAGPSQLAGNAMHGAMTSGRIETYRQGPVGAIYASEKNDAATCQPCHEVDGRWLGNTDDMAQIQLSYPGGALGGYVYCLGGYNCRGTIVGVWRRGTGDQPPVPAAPPEEPPAPAPTPEPAPPAEPERAPEPPAPEPEPVREPEPIPEPEREEPPTEPETPEHPTPEPEPAAPGFEIKPPTTEKGGATRRNWAADEELELGQLVGRGATAQQIAQAKTDLAAELKTDFAGKKVATRVTEDGLARLLADGRFRTLFETGESRALSDVGLRTVAEDAMFGIGPDSDPKLRPVYGYLEMDDIRGPDGLVGVYGNVRVILKDEVRARTTATVGDSLGQSVLPSLVDDPSWEAANPGLRARLGAPGRLHRIDYAQYQEDLYVETQIHGGVTTGDIELIILGSPPSPALRKVLDKSGIPWEVLG